MNIETHGVIYTGNPGSDSQSAIFPALCIADSGRWWCAFRAAPAKISNVGQRVLLTWSDDEGLSWSTPVDPFPSPVHHGKPGRFRTGGLCDLGNGVLLATLAWVDYSTPEVAYFNETTEGLLDTHIFVSRSEDNGATWSEARLVDTPDHPVPTPLTGPPIQHSSGSIFCQFELNKAYEDVETWTHLSVLLVSEDGGQHWTRHSVPAADPSNTIFYWDQRVSALPDGRLFDVFWTFDRATSDYLNIHATFSQDEGATWCPLWDTGVPGQPGPVMELADGSLLMPVVDRSGAPKITVRQSHDGGLSWPIDGCVVLFDSDGGSQTEVKASMQDAWAEMYAFSIGLPHAASLPDGRVLVAYYAGDTTDQTSIRFAVLGI